MEISDEEEQLESHAASQNVDLDDASVGSSASVSRRVEFSRHGIRWNLSTHSRYLGRRVFGRVSLTTSLYWTHRHLIDLSICWILLM